MASVSFQPNPGSELQLHQTVLHKRRRNRLHKSKAASGSTAVGHEKEFRGLPTTFGSFCRLSGIRGSFVLIRLNRPHRIRLAFLLLVELSWLGLKRDDAMEIQMNRSEGGSLTLVRCLSSGLASCPYASQMSMY